MSIEGAIGLGIGGTLAGGLLQDRATKKANKLNMQQQALALAALDVQFGKSIFAHEQGLGEIRKGYQEASRAIEGVGASARAGLERREKRGLAAADRSSFNRGVYNSTGGMNRRRAVREETNLQLSALNESLARMHAGIIRERTQALSQGYFRLGGVHQNLGVAKANVYGQTVHQAANIGGTIAAGIGSLTELLLANEDEG